ncbi:MAG TPA: hypothetical protein VKT28_00500 [Puia sp.]|nr:hypothetical protein [Puia sp.]
MATKKTDFGKVLQQCELVVKEMGLTIQYTHNLDPFFKGDLDGKTIFIGDHLAAEEKLFNLLHLAGHSIQWNIDSLLRDLGSHLFRNPGDELLKKLQTYEWQANCYALSILHKAKIANLDKWLTKKYVLDMMYLTHFYKTGEKLKRITKIAKEYSFKRDLESKSIPSFTPKASKRTRNGIVISF